MTIRPKGGVHRLQWNALGQLITHTDSETPRRTNLCPAPGYARADWLVRYDYCAAGDLIAAHDRGQQCVRPSPPRDENS